MTYEELTKMTNIFDMGTEPFYLDTGIIITAGFDQGYLGSFQLYDLEEAIITPKVSKDEENRVINAWFEAHTKKRLVGGFEPGTYHAKRLDLYDRTGAAYIGGFLRDFDWVTTSDGGRFLMEKNPSTSKGDLSTSFPRRDCAQNYHYLKNEEEVATHLGTLFQVMGTPYENVSEVLETIFNKLEYDTSVIGDIKELEVEKDEQAAAFQLLNDLNNVTSGRRVGRHGYRAEGEHREGYYGFLSSPLGNKRLGSEILEELFRKDSQK